jgi:hypothetical protein
VRVNSKKRLTKGNETGNVENEIWRELVKLHAIDKEEPTKKLVGREKGHGEQKLRTSLDTRLEAWGCARHQGR